MANMNGKVVAITGAGSGIARALAKVLASRGAILSLADRDQEGLNDTLKVLEGSKHITTVVDVRSTSGVEAWIDKTVKQLGKLDGAANLAGVHTGKGRVLAEETDENWDFIFDVNAKGVFKCMRSELNHMAEGGSIVNAASVAGIKGIPNSSIYVASKHAVVGMTKSAARENGHRNIRINAIAPGTIDTPMVQKIEAGMGSRLNTKVQCLDRHAQPEEMATVIAFMLSDEASFVTGACWSADGGWQT
jgi:NAD(P)-dependent dehydrogenase (short-subunit alcohol dehydrogenase family)